MSSSAIQIVGDLRQANQEKDMADFNRSVANQNAAIVQQQATENARRSLVNSNKLMGKQRAGYAASGVSGGSALDVLQDTAVKGELDALTIKNQGDIKAAGFANESNLSGYRASNALTTGYVKATGHAVEGAEKAAGKP